MQTIEQLRKNGYKVRVIHSRFVTPVFYNYKPELTARRLIEAPDSIMAKGGHTRIELRSPEGIEVFGEAHCSKEDTFDRKKGNVKALGRALAVLGKLRGQLLSL